MSTKKFTNPYPLPSTYNPETHGRLFTDIPASEKNYLRSIDSSVGMVQTLLNTLVYSFIAECRRQGFSKSDDRTRFRDFAANLKVVDGRKK